MDTSMEYTHIEEYNFNGAVSSLSDFFEIIKNDEINQYLTTFSEYVGEQLILEAIWVKCPVCNNVDEFINDYVCSYCGFSLNPIKTYIEIMGLLRKILKKVEELA